MIWVWSGSGFGDMSRKLHRWARDYGIRRGSLETRDVLLNNWEATGFDFDFNRIANLFAPAKNLGVELFLLDDGWFGNKYPRVNDHAGLGDWQPNKATVCRSRARPTCARPPVTLWIDYVNALYALMNKTAETFPDTELMLCSGAAAAVWTTAR